MSLWTPEGEHRVPRPDSGGPTGAPPADGDWRERLANGELGLEDLTPEQRAEVDAVVAQMAEAQQQLLGTPAPHILTQHIIGLREYAILHLQQQDPDFVAASMAIDAIGGIIDAAGDRLAELAEPLRADLLQLQAAFVERKAQVEEVGPGE
jgi:hypothetical protein